MGCCGGSRKRSNPFGFGKSQAGARSVTFQRRRVFGRAKSSASVPAVNPITPTEVKPNEENVQDSPSDPISILPSVSPESSQGGSQSSDGHTD